jgi:uncharacterized protein (TIGR00369 family)
MRRAVERRGTVGRRLLVEWADPAALAESARGLTGIEFLRALSTGELPPAPIQELLGFRLGEVDEGRAVFWATPAEQHYNPVGVVHAGLAATLLLSALGAAVHTTLPAGSACATVETSLKLVRAIKAETGEIRCEAVVADRRADVANAEGRLTRVRDGELLAHGASKCVVLRRRI